MEENINRSQRKKKLRCFAPGISLGFVLIYDRKKVKTQRASEQKCNI